MIQKSYDNKPSLYIVSTPIGNMDDITYRAVKILSEVDAIFCEDTRVTALLLNKFGIKKQLISNHKFNEHNNNERIVKLLEKNNNIALVSDRGTPIISDPGYSIVKYVIDKGYKVVSIPGVSAFLPALTSSGINPIPFVFFGFLDSNENIRKKQLLELTDNPMTIIFYESPHRIKKTLNNIMEIFGNREISISREITKRFEEVIRGNISTIIKELEVVKGEFVIVVEGSKEIQNDLSIIDNVNVYIKQGFSIMDSIKKTAKERKIPKSEVYAEYHKLGGFEE